MTTGYLCNLIIPGAAKSGSSSLHNALRQHPRICMSMPKEPQFFSFDDYYKDGPERHNTIFSECSGASIYGESSQSYFVHEHAMERIANNLVNPKIIIMLRDPVKRLISQYSFNYKRATEADSLMQAVEARGDNVNYVFDERIGMYREEGGYLAFSRYSKYVPQWKAMFGSGNVLVLRAEDFYIDQVKVVTRCFDFLGLEIIDGIIPTHKNSTGLTHRVVKPGIIQMLEVFLPERLKNMGLYKKAGRKLLQLTTPAPDTNLRKGDLAKLKAILADDIEFHHTLY